MMLGTPKDEAETRFVFDNEKWGHPVTLAPFDMARCCVTNAEFLQFIDDGVDYQGWLLDA